MNTDLMIDDDVDPYDDVSGIWEDIPEKDKKRLMKAWSDKKETKHYIG